VAIQRVFVRQEGGGDVVRGGVHREVQLPPRPPLIRPVDSHLPLAFAVDLQPRRIDDQVLDARARAGREKAGGGVPVWREWSNEARTA
jgi:hypothetical protein